MRSKRLFTDSHKAELLHRVGAWRKDCIGLMARVPIHHAIYKALSDLTVAIDAAAEVATGDRRHFHTEANNALRGDRDKAAREGGRMDRSDETAR